MVATYEYVRAQSCIVYSMCILFLQRVRIARNAVLARGILSVCPPVCLSVTFQCFVQMNEDTIVQFSASCKTFILVSGEVSLAAITWKTVQDRR